MAKPFSIQSPEEIAKEYGGNKQKIAEAMQLGIVDSTAGVLAGMFIDRMRAAQMQEQVPQQTVAQQVFTPQPQMPPQGAPAQVPPAPQPGAPAGLGAIAPQGGEPVPEAPMPQMPQEAPVGMAMGGVAGLPIPDNMFDEPDNGGYAGGGLVAFGDGGEVPGFRGGGMPSVYREPEDLEAYKRWAANIIRRESGGRYGIPNRQGSGAMGVGQIMPDTGRALAKIAGLEWRPDLMAGTSPEAKDYQNKITGLALREAWNSQGGNAANASGYYFAGPDRKKWGAKTRDYIKGTAGRLASDDAPASSGGLGSLAGATSDWSGGQSLAKTFEETIPKGLEAYDKYMPKPKREGRDKLLNYITEQGSEEALKKQSKEDLWGRLAEFGFNMAATNSPYFLQAMGAAAAATLPGVKADKKEREARKLRAFQAYADAEGIDNEEAKQRAMFGLNYAKDMTGYKKDEIGRLFEQNKTIFQEAAQTERTRMGVEGELEQERIRNLPGPGGLPKDLSPTQMGEAMARALKQAEVAYKAARAAESAGNPAEVERYLNQYGAARAAYNKFAKLRGEAEMTQADLSAKAFPSLVSYIASKGLMPSGRRSPSYDRNIAAQRGRENKGSDAGSPPPGVTQAEWNAMTPQERALFR